MGFTKEKILECYRFTDQQTIGEYQEMLLQAQKYAEKSELSSAGSSVIGFWVAEALLLKGHKKMVGFASAERNSAERNSAERNSAERNTAESSDKSNGNCLTMLYIDPLYQRRGIGNMLMEKIREFIDQSRDTTLVVVDFNEQAQNFYLKHGFNFDEKGSEPAYCGSLFGAKRMRLLAKS